MTSADRVRGRVWDESSEEEDERGTPPHHAGVLQGLTEEWSDPHPTPDVPPPPSSSEALIPTVAYTSPNNASLSLHLLLIPSRGIPFQLWPASLLLCRHLDFPSIHPLLHSLPILELGAGCGLAGLLAASLGAHVTVTDLPPVIPHLLSTVHANPAFTLLPASTPSSTLTFSHPSGGSITCLPLVWGQPLPAALTSPLLVLVADCVYWEELFEPLLATLREVCGVGARVWLSQTPRRVKVEGRFFKKARKWFDCRVLERWRQQHSDRQPLALYELTRKEHALHAGPT